MKCLGYKELAAKSKRAYDELKLGEGAESVGRRLSAFESSHIIVAYPPQKAMEHLNPRRIRAGSKDLAMYLHIPFCLNKCAYCHYASTDAAGEKEHKRYLDYLKREMQMVSDALGVGRRKVHSIHIGGGTPTVLRTGWLVELLSEVKSRFNVAKTAEVTLESCPRTLIKRIKEDNLDRILEAGVNRLSIGVQTFNDKLLKIAGREHSGKEAHMAVELARRSGFKNINVDMMIGLPGQSLKTLHRDLEILGELQPESLTLYHLRLKSHVPMYDLLMNHRGYFPTQEDSLTMDLMFRDYMSCLGYDEDPINWFNKSPKYRYQHQFDKWEDKKDLIALGLSAYSYINNTQYFNHSEVDDYYSSIEAGIMPVNIGAVLQNDELSRRHMIFKLKTKEGVNKKEHEQLYNIAVDDEYGTRLAALEQHGLVENSPDRVSLTEKGALFADEIARQFYSEKVNKRLQ